MALWHHRIERKVLVLLDLAVTCKGYHFFCEVILMKRLTRGELAKQSGVNFATIRYYEKLGLLPEPPRTNAGYRMFSHESTNRRFIK